jgi:ABC-type antimicrobial peptide transport system ATPase subunit
MPSGCRFAPRCTYAAAACQEPQRLRAVDDRHVRCVRASDLALAGAGG